MNNKKSRTSLKTSVVIEEEEEQEENESEDEKDSYQVFACADGRKTKHFIAYADKHTILICFILDAILARAGFMDPVLAFPKRPARRWINGIVINV